jgi:hypothetical protein
MGQNGAVPTLQGEILPNQHGGEEKVWQHGGSADEEADRGLDVTGLHGGK